MCAVKNDHTVDDNTYWPSIDMLARTAVVQVFAQVSPFNWIQPYRIESPYESRGSGFFVTKEGHFVTSAHVVSEARRVWVNIPALGKVPLPAAVIGMCPETDVALARLQDEALSLVIQQLNAVSYFECGDSDDVTLTEAILALGYPLGQNHIKSTTGVISGREFLNGRPFIQVTAPVNPGNSGGPLVGKDGKVLGITVAGVIEAQSIGYAIPINEFTIIYDELMKGGLVRKPNLGIILGCANDEKASYLKNPQPAGLYIAGVIEGSLCDSAGVHEGDMLYELNGYTIDAYGETNMAWGFGRSILYDLFVKMKIGQEISMVLYRRGNRIDLRFAYVMREPLPIRRYYPGYEPIDYEIIGGLVLMSLSDDHIDIFFDARPDLMVYAMPQKRAKGVVIITYVFPGSYAHHVSSFIAGDIIQYVNNQCITDLASLRRAILDDCKTSFIAIKTERGALVVFSLELVLRDEARLSADFVYPISHTITQLQHMALSGTINNG